MSIEGILTKTSGLASALLNMATKMMAKAPNIPTKLAKSTAITPVTNVCLANHHK